jgi:hypothetical protein
MTSKSRRGAPAVKIPGTKTRVPKGALAAAGVAVVLVLLWLAWRSSPGGSGSVGAAAGSNAWAGSTGPASGGNIPGPVTPTSAGKPPKRKATGKLVPKTRQPRGKAA